ncbi:MAG: general secretion pathway protein GspK [Bryobacteraceae bacterium]
MKKAGCNAMRERGGALLAVLWLSAALTAIAFSVANTVRGETERVSTAADGVRAHYLATGAVERALLYMQWQHYSFPNGAPRYYRQGMPRLYFTFPAGDAVAEITPETSKLSINQASREQLYRLLVMLGAEPDRASVISAAILDWRMPAEGITPFDAYYLSLAPSFRARHASFEEIEEVLMVQGMTPELFYGTYERTPDGQLAPRAGLRDCLSVYGGVTGFDVNTVQPAVMAAMGMSPDLISAIVSMRQVAPISHPQLGAIRQSSPAAGHLMIGGGAITTVRATARLRLADGSYSDIRRSVSAMVKFIEAGGDKPYHVLRWYESASPLL